MSFPYWGIEGVPPTSLKFADSPLSLGNIPLTKG